MDHLWQDIRYGARMLAKSPGFAITAVLTLAIGIGATSSVFSVCDALLWKPVALPHLETLAIVIERDPEDPDEWHPATPADLADVRRESKTLSGLADYQFGLANLVGAGGEPERVTQILTTANFFDVLGVKPAIGRTFEKGEDQPGREREVVLSDMIWKRRFGGDRSIVGRTIRLDDENYLVIGVMPSTFQFPQAAEIWTPHANTPEQNNSRVSHSLVAIGRLQPGMTVPQADAEVATISASTARQFPDTNKGRSLMVWSAHQFLVERKTAQYLVMLLGSVSFVLMIACVNVANLQFARGTSRLREVAVRTALGASRGRVMTQLVTESILLSLGGAVLGLLFARWGVSLIKGGMPPEIERFILNWREIALDWRVVVFSLVAGVASGILSGLAPAWQASRPNLAETLREGGRSGSAGGTRHRLRNLLVGAEVALAVVLLVGSGLMIRGFQSMVAQGQRLDPESLLTLRLAITEHKYKEPHQVAGFYRDVVERIGAVPGVKLAAGVSSLPYSDHSSGRNFILEGKTPEPGRIPNGMYQLVTPAYFELTHLPLIDGRFLSSADGPDSQKVTVVSQRLAKRWWPNESPLGKRLKLGSTVDAKSPWLTVVGIVADEIHNTYDREPRPTLYVPEEQAPSRWLDIGVRTAGDPLRVAPAVTAAIRAVDPEQPITEMMTMERMIHNRAIGLNYMAVMMGVFGALALLLSAIGVYGVMAYVVAEETHEIGIRMALGAEQNNVLAMIFRRGMTTILAGLAVGLPAAFAISQLLASLIYGVTPRDLVTFASIPAALLLAAMIAIYIPARRAVRIDPVIALRYE